MNIYQEILNDDSLNIEILNVEIDEVQIDETQIDETQIPENVVKSNKCSRSKTIQVKTSHQKKQDLKKISHKQKSNEINSNMKKSPSIVRVNKESKNELKSSESNKKPIKKPSKIVVKLAIEILQKLDPDQELNLVEIEEALNQQIHQTEDLIEIAAIEYLIDSFDTLENQYEKMVLCQENRCVQEKNLKGRRIKKEVFDSKIDLTLPKKDRQPDENDRIYKTGKSIYSSKNQGYKNVV